MPTLEITVLGPLLVAGHASLLGADLSTARRHDGEHEAPYIPATALRGAVRLQLEALLRGAGRDAAGPYPLDPTGASKERPAKPDDPVARLFGYSGPKGEREDALEGQLRFGDAIPVDAARAAAAIRVRPGLEIDDLSATAADRKLFFREVADVGCDLVFRAPLDLLGVAPADLGLLRAAVETTDALGAGKSKGGGELKIRWLDEEASTGAIVVGDPRTARRARLEITLLEPAHFGDGGPLGNHQATRTYIPGATIRGAIAWALLRSEVTTADSEAFRALFLDPEAASFGDALALDSHAEEPQILPATAREARAGEATDDVLISELARARVGDLLAARGSTLILRADDGDKRFDPIPDARPEAGLLRRTRTRVSIDRETGAAADGRLFSIEQIEAITVERKAPRFVSWIEGIPPQGAGLLAQIKGLPIALGAGRNHGLGRAQIGIRFEATEPPFAAEARVRELSAAVDREAKALALRVGIDPTQVPQRAFQFALVAAADYVPTSADAPHPLAEAPLAAKLPGISPSRKFLRTGAVGGFDQRKDRPGPLKDLLPTIAAGSVFVYEIEGDRLADLDDWLVPLRRGVGQRVDSGCGRFVLHSEPLKKPGTKEGVIPMSTDVSASELVKKAEALLDRVHTNERPKGRRSKFWGQTSQLRNLVQITQTESEVPVLRNFIRYQQGRRSTRDFWELIGDTVIGILEKIDTETAGDAAVRSRAIRSFFGYLVRYYVYLNETQREGDERPQRRAS